MLKPVSADELEAIASQYLGRLLMIFGRIEMDVALALANSEPPERFAIVIAQLERLSFAEKLEALRQRVDSRHHGEADSLSAWTDWYVAADRLRRLRNRFAHGRWGILPLQQQIAHVSGLPGSPDQTECHYTMSELALEVEEAARVARDFSALPRLYQA